MTRLASRFGAVNLVRRDRPLRTDRPGFSVTEQSPLITHIDILRARKTTGLMTRNGYKAVTDITTGKYAGVSQ